MPHPDQAFVAARHDVVGSRIADVRYYESFEASCSFGEYSRGEDVTVLETYRV
jgi:hypothetical protein